MTPVLVIAHRGASAVAPESTRAAITAAVQAGARMIELDVQMTRDARLIVFHDDRLERTTNGRGPVRRTRYRDLARLDAGAWFHPRFVGERILTPAQAVRALPRRVTVNFELKRTRRPVLLLRRVRALARRAGAGRILWSSFDPALVRRLAAAGLPRALICRRRPARSLESAIRLGCRAWHPALAIATRSAICRAHAAGLRVHVWTVDRARDARRLAGWGADGIFTNNPARLRRRLAAR